MGESSAQFWERARNRDAALEQDLVGAATPAERNALVNVFERTFAEELAAIEEAVRGKTAGTGLEWERIEVDPRDEADHEPGVLEPPSEERFLEALEWNERGWVRLIPYTVEAGALRIELSWYRATHPDDRYRGLVHPLVYGFSDETVRSLTGRWPRGHLEQWLESAGFRSLARLLARVQRVARDLRTMWWLR